MTDLGELLRTHLTDAENALVTGAEVQDALERAVGGAAARTRVEVAALRVYRGAACSRVPALESRPLRRPLLVRLVTPAHPGRSGGLVNGAPYPASGPRRPVVHAA